MTSEEAGRSSGERVPVEHRFLGLDRRTFGPALVVLAIALLLIYGGPR